MRKLLLTAVLLLAATGCARTCQNVTIFSAKGCKMECCRKVDQGRKVCECTKACACWDSHYAN